MYDRLAKQVKSIILVMNKWKFRIENYTFRGERIICKIKKDRGHIKLLVFMPLQRWKRDVEFYYELQTTFEKVSRNYNDNDGLLWFYARVGNSAVSNIPEFGEQFAIIMCKNWDCLQLTII